VGEDQEPKPETFHANRSNFGFYGQQQLDLLDNLHVLGGVRYDQYDGIGGKVTGSAAGTYLVQTTQTRLRLSYAGGFRAPTFDELFDPFLGNASLRPETSNEVDVGFTQPLWPPRASFTATYFYRAVDNFIEELSDQLPGAIAGVPEEARGRNLDATFQGVETSAQVALLAGLKLSANYTYLDFHTPTGTLLNRPRNRGSVLLAGQWANVLAPGDDLASTVQLYAVGSRDSALPFDRMEPFSPALIGGYTRTDLSLSYAASGRLDGWVVTATVQNLFNRSYSESFGFPAPPANVFVRLRYRFTLPWLSGVS
jgi:vitamin B12 transporter